MVASKDMPPLPKNFGKVFWNNQFKVQIEVPTLETYPSLKDRVAVVTGANSGLGFEAAKQLLTLGLSHLVVAVRSVEKGELAATELRRANPKAVVDVWALDMESYDSIRAFVRKCAELPRIDYVVLNAGVAMTKFSTIPSTGHETTVQVNHISTALLAILLLPILTSKPPRDDPPRMTVINSVMAHLCKFPNRDKRPLLSSCDDIEKTPWNAEERYGVSKLLSQLFLVKLADHVKSDNVVINMVDPGLTKGTGLSRNATGLVRIASMAFFGIAGRTVDRGAATYVDALVRHGKESHGCFLMNEEISPLATFYYSTEGKAAQEQIWEETMKELSFANVNEIVDSMK